MNLINPNVELDRGRRADAVRPRHKKTARAKGIEMADAIRAEHRHRYNHRMSERRRAGFPAIGHFKIWTGTTTRRCEGVRSVQSPYFCVTQPTRWGEGQATP